MDFALSAERSQLTETAADFAELARLGVTLRVFTFSASAVPCGAP